MLKQNKELFEALANDLIDGYNNKEYELGEWPAAREFTMLFGTKPLKKPWERGKA